MEDFKKENENEKENLEKIAEMLSVGDFNLDNYRKLMKK